MKRGLLVWIAAATLAASQGAVAQLMGPGNGGAMGDWEFRIGPVFQQSKNVEFNGGSNADIDSTTGIRVGTGYYVTNDLIVGMNFGWSQSTFNGTVKGNLANSYIENGHVDFSTLMFDAQYVFPLRSAIKPFVVAGLGWNWINTNIAAGPPQVGCWWDPWWGYVCSGYQPTHGSNSFAYQAGAGVQLNFTRTFSINVDYRYSWIDLSNANGTPGFGAVGLMFVWRFPSYHY
ncbi:MAG TPA: outer membrane beta-barrel protein [Steroidobacteraceae bacterium]|nr:outer membrane beta-barrel protein [Steroidobacteraceae bacterium]